LKCEEKTRWAEGEVARSEERYLHGLRVGEVHLLYLILRANNIGITSSRAEELERRPDNALHDRASEYFWG
jgi:hypothetical protein